MERSWVTLTVLLTLALGCAARHCPLLHAAEGANKTGCYIVVLHKETSPEKFTEIIQRATNMAEGHKLHGLVQKVTKAFTVKLSDYSLNLLRQVPEIKYIEEETMVEAVQTTLPYHLDRIDQRQLPLDGVYDSFGDGEGVDIYILDTGISYEHEEFENRAKYSGYDPMDVYRGEAMNGSDCHSHGTHVASNAAGKKYGAAKKVTLYSVRVLNCWGFGPWSIILDGMDHAMEMIALRKRPAIVSMSLGGGYAQSVNDAVQTLYDSGIPVVVAAGNEQTNACRRSPASAPNAITVGGSANGDSLYSRTNYGSCVDIFAPGDSVIGADYLCDNCSRTRSGTSLAAPIVSGAIAVLLQKNPLLSPGEVFSELISLSTNNSLNFSTIPSNFRASTPNRALFIPDKKQECDNKIAELEMKILALETKEKYRQYFFLSFMEQLHSISSEHLTDHIGTTRYPAWSCSDIKHVVPHAPSGQYWIRNPMGHVSQQYCDMERKACGTRGGWMRVAHLDMIQPDHSCPLGFRTITSPKRLCGRPGPPGCVSVKFPTYNIPYNKVCGKVIAYQDKTPDAQCQYHSVDTHLEGAYIDGVSLTHGTPGNRSHIWSFIASVAENFNDCRGCPCYNNFTGIHAPFIGNNFFCDSGIERWRGRRRLNHEDPLWDGQGCGSNSECCTFNNPPWFCTELDQSTSDDIELRLCADEDTSNEDVPIEHIELYIQ